MGSELHRNGDPDALVTGHVAVLGLGTASEALMMEAKQRADAAGVVLNLHQSYSPADTEADRQRFGGKDPVVHLAETGFLDRNVTFGHANHLTDAECDALLERGHQHRLGAGRLDDVGPWRLHPRPARRILAARRQYRARLRLRQLVE